MGAQDHDFNWVQARQDCTVQVAFGCFRREARRAVDERNQLFPNHEKDFGNKLFSVDGVKKEDGYRTDVFRVLRHDNGGEEIAFQLFLDKGYIRVIRKLECKDSFLVTLTLGDDGECRYQIDGKGKHLRWQVINKALEKLLFVRTEG